MGVNDAPQWLISAFVRACTGVGASAPPEQIEAVGERLLDRWSAEDRHYHNLRHLTEVLMRVDELVEETHDPDVVRLAAWYHGAVFDAAERACNAQRGGEDEQASAALARQELLDLGVPEDAVARISHLVSELVRHNPPADDMDCAVLCDADMAMLAAEPQRYKTYLSDLRAEYAHLPVEEFVRARIAILRKLARRPRLFTSPLGAAWEEPARQNTAAELHRLEKELRTIEAAQQVRDGDEPPAQAPSAGSAPRVLTAPERVATTR